MVIPSRIVRYLPQRALLCSMGRVSHLQAAMDEVLVEETGSARVAILNRPKKLNSLTFDMVVRLQELYQNWEQDTSVAVIILKGNGRAFCAGGDVAKVCELGKQGLCDQANSFFYKEYVLNYMLSTLRKPHVALLNGVVMGGGNGVSLHGMYRVATEKTLFAMPEAALGLHPDVGASYFLSRLPDRLGEYLGLTGDRLDGADMVSLGLATHFVPSERIGALEADLRGVTSPAAVKEILVRFSGSSSLRAKSPIHRSATISSCFSRGTVRDILEALKSENEKDEWLEETILKLSKASPTSLKITLASIRKGREQSIAECLIREYRMSFRAVTGKFSKDFYEGCRSILIDKDNLPKWDPPTLDDVPESIAGDYFAELRDEGQELELPVEERSNLPSKM